MFQPSSDLQAGCNARRSSPPTSASRFNPHPTFRPDATPGVRLPQRRHPVSTLIRPSGRMQRPAFVSPNVGIPFQPSSDLQAGCNARAGAVPRPFPVSTLIRPSGRMQPVTHAVDRVDAEGVSTLIRPSGRMQLPYDVLQRMTFLVSTLIRPSGRMQPRAASKSAARLRCQFQPSSDLQAGCNLPRREPGHCRSTGFNPHPTFRPDATVYAGSAGRSRRSCFNPHPTFRPDATSK